MYDTTTPRDNGDMTGIDGQLDMMAQILARRAEDREVPGSSPARD